MTFLSGQNAWSARWKHRLFGGVAIVWLTMITPSLAQTGQSDAPARTATLEKLIEAGRLTQAREALAKLHAAQEQTPTTRYLEAKLLFRERRFVDSLRQLEPLISKSSGLVQVEANKLAGLNYAQLNRLDLAEPFLKAATELAPGDALAHFHLGMLFYTTSRFAAAENEFRQTVTLQPAFAKAYDGLGLALEELGRDEDALRAWRKAVELLESQKLRDGSPSLNLGKFLLTKNRWAESLPLLQKAAQLSPNSAEAWFLWGKALFKSDQAASAVKALTQAVQLASDYAEAHYLLSRIYLYQGRAEEAQKELRIFQELQSRKTNQ